jgi:hypothetical protein
MTILPHRWRLGSWKDVLDCADLLRVSQILLRFREFNLIRPSFISDLIVKNLSFKVTVFLGTQIVRAKVASPWTQNLDA